MSDIGRPLEPVPEGQLRVGDRERHAAVTALGEHFATGRLDQQEFDERIQAAYAARTRTDLQRLFVDLPEPAPFRAGPSREPALARPAAPSTDARQWRPPFLFPLLPLLFVALVVISIVARVPVFPLFFLFLWFGVGRRGWRGPRRYAGPRSW